MLVRDIIRDQRRRGATVFLNSHLLSEIEITCDRVVFIKQGEVLHTKELNGSNEDEIYVSVRAGQFTSEVVSGLAARVGPVEMEGEKARFRVSSETVLPDIARYLVAQGVDVYEIRPQRLSLEELFVQIVGTDGGL
jgi:ABC-2 type transport system ATP-binding protein